MKKALFITLMGMSSLFPISASNDTQEQSFKVPVQAVTVYLTGAQITHSKQVQLKAGRNLITFTGLSSKLISKSVQATVTGEVSLFSVSDKMNYLSLQQETPRVKQLKDSLKLLGEEVSLAQYEQEAFETEKKLLVQNEMLSGKDKGVTTAELKLAADFYRVRIRDINSELYKYDKKLKTMEEITRRLNEQIVALNGTRSVPTSEVSVLVSAPVAMTTMLEVKYIVSGAGWAPSYDLIAEEINKPIQLKYRAKVFNNTDVDWTDVKMKISSADPTQSASKPQLDSWYVNFNTGNGYSNNASSYQNIQSQSNSNLDLDQVALSSNKEPRALGYSVSEGSAEISASMEKAKSAQKAEKPVVTYEQIQVSELSAEFDIKNPYTVPSDSKPYIVEVTTYTLPATYKYYSVPKVNRDAFMLARITGWEDLDLVEGPANVYFGGTFVGQSYIYTRSVDDTLDLSLGRDSKIVVTRTKQKDFSNDKVIGNNRKVTYAYEMVIKNNRKAPVTINLEDQLPVSQNNDITVDAVELSKAQQDVLTGKLSWTYTILPGEQQKIQLTYSIKYPRNKTISLQKTKMRARAKF
jgi:uncharacterized protein (TIGR02231 family)